MSAILLFCSSNISSLSKFTSGSTFSILLKDRSTTFKRFSCEIGAIFRTSDPCIISLSRFSIYSNPFRLSIP